jgi:osmotically-inducible protein OsmY
MNVYDTLVKQIEESLMSDERTQDANIEVTNERGIVTLSGEVETAEIAATAEAIARDQSGVIKVVNSLVIEDEKDELEAAAPNLNGPVK